jgi:hypothetical protein
MKKKLDEEENENSLEYAKLFKPHLRFDYGAVVHLKSDIKKKCPMTIVAIFWDSLDVDYRVNWLTSQKTKESAPFVDQVLML